MGALYEDVENFFGDIFAWYGRIVARFPLIFTIVPLLSCIIFGLGLFNIHYETNIENLYSPINSDAQRDRQLLKSFFDHNYHHYHHNSSQHSKARPGNTTTHESRQGHQHSDAPKKLDFRFHQQINYPAYIEIIVFNKKRKNDSSVENSTCHSNFSSQHLSNYLNHFEDGDCQIVAFDKDDQRKGHDLTNVDELFDNLTQFSSDSWVAIQLLYRAVATQKGPKNPNFHYGSVCARFGEVCAVDVLELSDDKTACMFPRKFFSQKSPSSKFHPLKSTGKKVTTMKPRKASTTSSVEIIHNQTHPLGFSETQENPAKHFQPSPDSNEISYLPPLSLSPTAKALKLRFNLRGETHGQGRQRHLRWQDAMLDYLKRFRSPVIDIAFVASDSLEIELRDHVGGDTKYFALSVVAMLISATLAGNGGSLDHVILAYTGVVAALLAILGAFGLLSLAGASFVNLCSVMPFLVLG